MRYLRVQVDGIRYRIGERADGQLDLLGPRVLGGYPLPDHLRLDSPDLRREIAAAASRYRQHRVEMREWCRANLKLPGPVERLDTKEARVAPDNAGLEGSEPVMVKRPIAVPAIDPAEVYGLDGA